MNQFIRRYAQMMVFVSLVITGGSQWAFGQVSMPMGNYPPVVTSSGPRVHNVADYSWINLDPVEERVFSVNDLITVIVNEKSLVNVNSKFTRQKNGQLKAELKEFIGLDQGDLVNNASTSPTIDVNLQGRLNGTGGLTESEGINYRIQATVVDIYPNGNLVLEAAKTIQTNEEFWEYSLSGIIRSEDVERNNTILSEKVADMQVFKKQRGRTFSSSKRSWGVKLYDWLSPF